MSDKALGSYTALLRSINVGGKNKLPMKDLTALFEAAGAKRVRTYVQSGNVVFEASTAVARGMPKRITAAIEHAFGYQVPVVVRTAKELARIVDSHPFVTVDADPKKIHVAFLADEPTADQIASLDPNRSPGDVFVVHGREVYLSFPNGVGRSKLTNRYLDRQLGTMSTLRNWRTVLALLELART